VSALPFLKNALEYTALAARSMQNPDDVSSSSDSDAACASSDSSLCQWARQVVKDTQHWTRKAVKLAEAALEALRALETNLGVLSLVQRETRARAQRSATFRLRNNLHVSSAIGPQGNGLSD
jgi:hypothetical protein